MNCARSGISAGLLTVLFGLAAASDQPRGPQAAERTYAQNYRDMVLATCIANAYKGEPGAAMDAGSSVSALRDWTLYDMEHAPDSIRQLVDQYLARDYRNPIVDQEIGGVRFDLLKCLDLYHSTELQRQVQRHVLKPKQRSSQARRPR